MTEQSGQQAEQPVDTAEQQQGTEESIVVADVTKVDDSKKSEDASAKVEELPQEEPEWFKNRMARVTRQKYQQETRIAELESKLAQANTQPAPEINRDDFVDDGQWVQELAKREATVMFNEQQKQQSQQQQAYQRAQLATKQWDEKLNEFKDELTDYAEVVGNAKIDLTPDVVQDIMESDVGPRLAYYLAKNPSEADKVVDMTDRSRLRYLTRLETKLETPITPQSVRPVSRAPVPVTTPKGSGGAKVISMDDWIKSRNADDRKRGML